MFPRLSRTTSPKVNRVGLGKRRRRGNYHTIKPKEFQLALGTSFLYKSLYSKAPVASTTHREPDVARPLVVKRVEEENPWSALLRRKNRIFFWGGGKTRERHCPSPDERGRNSPVFFICDFFFLVPPLICLHNPLHNIGDTYIEGFPPASRRYPGGREV